MRFPVIMPAVNTPENLAASPMTIDAGIMNHRYSLGFALSSYRPIMTNSTELSISSAASQKLRYMSSGSVIMRESCFFEVI